MIYVTSDNQKESTVSSNTIKKKRGETIKSKARSFLSHLQEQDKSSDIEQQPPFGDRKDSKTLSQKKGKGIQNQREHHIIKINYEAVHPIIIKY